MGCCQWEPWETSFGTVTSLILEDLMRPYSRRSSCVLTEVLGGVNHFFASRSEKIGSNAALGQLSLCFHLYGVYFKGCLARVYPSRCYHGLAGSVAVFFGQDGRSRTCALSRPRGALYQLSYILNSLCRIVFCLSLIRSKLEYIFNISYTI